MKAVQGERAELLRRRLKKTDGKENTAPGARAPRLYTEVYIDENEENAKRCSGVSTCDRFC